MNQKKTLSMATRKQTNPIGQSDGRNGHRPSSGRLPWYLAGPTIPGLTYALTTTGYVVLSWKN